MIEIGGYTVRVETHTRIVYPESMREIHEMLKPLYSKVIYLIDTKVPHLNEIIDEESNLIYIDSGEDIKTLTFYNQTVSKLTSLKVDKKAILVIIGGGALSDSIGFIASTYLRGIAFANVPSTLLGMVDAGIGGKNGLNVEDAKNQIGTIYQPNYIFILPTILRNLPLKDFNSGIAEVIKYALLFDKEFLEELEGIDVMDLYHQIEIQKYIIEKCVRWKTKIIECDPLDKNERMWLNFGHSFGHAIEILYQLKHGEAIALGMLIAIKLSKELKFLDSSYFERVEKLFRKYDLIRKVDWNEGEVMAVMYKDKKIEKDRISLILLSEIGLPCIEKMEVTTIINKIKELKIQDWI